VENLDDLAALPLSSRIISIVAKLTLQRMLELRRSTLGLLLALVMRADAFLFFPIIRAVHQVISFAWQAPIRE